jgi:hypothetical protein
MVELGGLHVEKMISPKTANGPWTMMCSNHGTEVSGDLPVKYFNRGQRPGCVEGDTIAVAGKWERWDDAPQGRNPWSIKVWEGDEGVYINLTDAAENKPSHSPALAGGRGRKTLSSVVDELATIKAEVVNAGLADSAEDLRAYVIHINIINEHNPLDMGSGPTEEDIPF